MTIDAVLFLAEGSPWPVVMYGWINFLLLAVSLKFPTCANHSGCESSFFMGFNPPCTSALGFFLSWRPWAQDRWHSEGRRGSHGFSFARCGALGIYSLPARQRKNSPWTGAVWKSCSPRCRCLYFSCALTLWFFEKHILCPCFPSICCSLPSVSLTFSWRT